MASTSDYAQLALLVYDVNKENKITEPSDWKKVEYFSDDPSTGFSYGVYENEKTTGVQNNIYGGCQCFAFHFSWSA